MTPWSLLLRVIPLVISPAVAISNCPIYGPVFPKPANLAQSKLLSDEFSALEKTLNDAVQTNSHSLVNTTAYSLVFFSAEEEAPLFEWHYTPSSYENHVNGVTKIDSDSIYRIASISKLVHIYMALSEIGDSLWNRPVTDFLPELKQQPGENDPIRDAKWEDVKLGDLGAYLANTASDRK
jgi:hypothetical protein